MTEILVFLYGVIIGVCIFSGFLLGWGVYLGIGFIYIKLKKDYKHTLKSYINGTVWETGFCSKRQAEEALFNRVNELSKILGHPDSFKNIESQVQCLGEGGHDLVFYRIETLYEARKEETHSHILDVPFKSYKYKCGCGFEQSFRWEELSKTKQKAFEKI